MHDFIQIVCINISSIGILIPVEQKVTNCNSLEEFEDTKGVIRIRISKKYRQHNGQMKKYKRTNNNLKNIHIKLKFE